MENEEHLIDSSFPTPLDPSIHRQVDKFLHPLMAKAVSLLAVEPQVRRNTLSTAAEDATIERIRIAAAQEFREKTPTTTSLVASGPVCSGRHRSRPPGQSHPPIEKALKIPSPLR